MSIRVDPTFLPELHRYGAFDVNACFNCGNCTAICPLSTETESFPRRMIRYAQIGLKDPLVATRELWLCYYCGDCSDTCPREAEPGEFMAAARRYAIARYDLTGLSRLLYTSTPFTILFLLLLAALLTVLMLAGPGDMAQAQQLEMAGEPLARTLFEFVSAELIHNVGITVIGIVVLAGIASIANMIYRMPRSGGVVPGSPPEGEQPTNVFQWVCSLVRTVLTEVFA
jgi:ferredoxin